jgi:predicted GTPase/uncharacterized protein (DUF697 family)
MENKKRLERVARWYDKLDEFLENIPDQVPDNIKEKIREFLLEDKELKQLIDDIKNQRPPRLLLIGNTGHGKSSLINALVGYYNATVSDVEVGTKTNNEPYNIFDENGKTIYTILDSRGINESTTDDSSEAEESLLKGISSFKPDAVIYVHKASERAGMDAEIKFIKKAAEKYKQQNGQDLPIAFVLTKCDELAPQSIKIPSEYNELKKNNINDAKEYFSKIVKENGLDPKYIIITSALMEYHNHTNEELEKLGLAERKNITPNIDGRYNIEELQNKLFELIKDSEAKMGMAISFRSNEILKNIANKFTTAFAGIGGLIGTTPIPISDIYILIAIEAVLVMIIANLAGREIDFESAGSFVLELGGVGIIGFIFKLIAQQGAKPANGLFPGAGSAISGVIAASGIKTIGSAAIKYYF